MDKKEFIVKASIEIYANNHKTAREAVMDAEELWEELNIKDYVDPHERNSQFATGKHKAVIIKKN